MGKIRTDSQALTLDRFLSKGTNVGANKGIPSSSEMQVVVPEKLMSVKKLIYAFENDCDQQLNKVFKKNCYVGFLQPDQILIQFETKLVLCQTFLLI